MSLRLALFGTLLIAAGVGATALAADHIDAPDAVADPSADITDVFAWTTPDTTKINLIMNVMPFAGADAAFSDAVVYAFHVNSSAGYGEAQTETLIRCKFYKADAIECWAGDEYVVGDPDRSDGIASASGKLKVFAGRRNDPFFFALNGFTAAVTAVKAAAPNLTFDAEGCPTVDANTSAALVGALQSDGMGGAATDTLAGAAVMSLVVQVDKSLVNAGGPVLGVWASTHRAN